MTEILRPGHDLVTLDRIQIDEQRLDPMYVAWLRRQIHTGSFRESVEEKPFDLRESYLTWKEENERAEENV